MRLNQFLAKHTTLSRRSADEAIAAGRVLVNEEKAEIGQSIEAADQVVLDGTPVDELATTTIMLHKPIKIICSKNQQGNVPTVYSLLPPEMQHLTYLGRLDKDTSGLLVMTNDGDLIQRAAHPKFEVVKIYETQLDKPLTESDMEQLIHGVELEDGISKLGIKGKGRDWVVSITEGRNRQVRRSFEALGYEVTKLHRTQIANLKLEDLPVGEFREIINEDIL